MAGLWEKWIRPPRSGELDMRNGDESAASQMVETYTVITTTPNSMVAAVHNRMPVILSPEHYQWWLEPKRFEPEFLKSILRPYPVEDMDYSIRRASDTIRSPVYIIRCLPDAIRRMVDSIRWPSYRLR